MQRAAAAAAAADMDAAGVVALTVASLAVWAALCTCCGLRSRG